MFVVGSHIGFVLVFEDLSGLTTVITHLQRMLMHAQDNDAPPPHLYGVFSSETSQEDREEFMRSLKGEDTSGSMIVVLDDDL